MAERDRFDDYDSPHFGRPVDRDYGGSDAGYRGSGLLGGDWPHGRRTLEPSGGQSGPMWGPPDRDYFGRSDEAPPPPRPSHAGRGPRTFRRSDARVREDVCDLLTDDERLDASDIEVIVQDNVVMLEGTVSDRGAKRRAESVAESVPGVRDVQNNLKVTALG
jgi:hypothetical protein